MLELTGARLVPGTIDVGGPGPEPRPSACATSASAGCSASTSRARESALHLQRLGFESAERPDGLDVTVPHWRRNDVTREADLIEEVARLHGVDDQLPATLPTPPRRGRRADARRSACAAAPRTRSPAAACSRSSAGASSRPTRDDRLRLPADDPRRRHVAIENPMSDDQSVLRTTLLGSLLDAAGHNAARGQGVPALFESGAVYLATGERLPHEHRALGALVPGDVFAAKGYLEALLRALRVDATFASRAAAVPAPRPQRRGARGGDRVGWVGDVHPLVAARGTSSRRRRVRDRPRPRDRRRRQRSTRYEDLTSFPELREDIAIVVDADRAGGDRARDRARRRAASCWRAPRSSTSTAASRSPPGASRWRSR